ncbi:transposase [Bacillus thuringiensis]
MHLVVDANGNPIKFMITGGEVSDFTKAVDLITGLKAEHLIADKGYDYDEIVRFAKSYTKTTSTFRGAVTVAAISQWLKLV